NDVIQGDGSIALNPDGSIANLVGASRDPVTGALIVSPSVEHPAANGNDPNADPTADGNDYIEGGGGSDVVFGGLGQDDIIGGNSNLFGQTTAAQRSDVGDILIGGAGTRLTQDDLGIGEDSTLGTFADHASDADNILGDNGNLYRLVTPS